MTHRGLDVLTVGEALGVFRSLEPSPLLVNQSFELSVAGAESTVAIGLARLGHMSAWLGHVGSDPIGSLVLSTLRGEGIEVLGRVDASRPTGMMVRSTRTARITQVAYARAGSAASALAPPDIEQALALNPRILHVSGVTAAVSVSAREAVATGLALAKRAGIMTSFDVNLRRLLTTEGAAADFLAEILPHLDLLFCGDDEVVVLAKALQMPTATLEALMEADFSGELVLKRGKAGAAARSGGRVAHAPAAAQDVVDLVGAGDAFAAGYLSAHLDGVGLEERLRRGAICAAFSVGGRGDWEGLPTRSELALLANGPERADR